MKNGKMNGKTKTIFVVVDKGGEVRVFKKEVPAAYKPSPRNGEFPNFTESKNYGMAISKSRIQLLSDLRHELWLQRAASVKKVG